MNKNNLQKNTPKESINFNTFSLEERNRLVGAFLWLLEEDKKQNKAFYILKLILRDFIYAEKYQTRK